MEPIAPITSVDSFSLDHHKELVQALAFPGEELHRKTTPNQAHINHMLIGFVGELGELEEAFNLFRPRENFIEEFGDLEFYFVGLCQGFQKEGLGVLHCFEAERVGDAQLLIEVSQRQGAMPLTLISCRERLRKFTDDLVDAIKRWIIYGDRTPEKATLIANTLQNIAVALSHTHVFLNTDLDEIRLVNYKKLAARYHKGKFTQEQAIARADESQG